MRWRFSATYERMPVGWSLGLGLFVIPGRKVEVGGSFGPWNFWAGWQRVPRW